MKEIHVTQIERTIAELCIRANRILPADLAACIRNCAQTEPNARAAETLRLLEENRRAAEEMSIPICQDTGMAVVFAELGQDAHIVGGGFAEAVNRGVARGYSEGCLRRSVVADPLRRENTGDNTPAVLYTELTHGDSLRLTVCPKGFGSENMSALRMFTPAAGRDDIVRFSVDTVTKAGGNPCPPLVLGVGIGSTFEGCALLAKRALCRPLGERNPDPYYCALEEEILARVNETGVGPQGLGGSTTALAVNVLAAPTHIAGLPVAINVGCHVTRHAAAIL
ncbi:MAG: fumarate hydratase [Oscillospiraceae bacterium]|jgi:fumarate hydratase subunit alpha|nr:fumarate hydratase [Oscillospiraceae bacterium]